MRIRPLLALVTLFLLRSTAGAERTPDLATGEARGAGATQLGHAAEPAFDHLALYVSDLGRSTAFYKDVFHFAEVRAPFPIARWLVTGNGIMLHIVSGRPANVENSKWDHFAVACNSLDLMTERLDKMHISWTDIQGRHEPQTRPDGVKQIFIRDPDGYWIEINDALKP